MASNLVKLTAKLKRSGSNEDVSEVVESLLSIAQVSNSFVKNEKVVSDVLKNCLAFIMTSIREEMNTYHVAKVIQFIMKSSPADEWFAEACVVVFPQLDTIYINLLKNNDPSLNLKKDQVPNRLTVYMKQQPYVLKTVSNLLSLTGDLCELTEDQLSDECLFSLKRMLKVSLRLLFDLGSKDVNNGYIELFQNYRLLELFREASFNVTGILDAFRNLFIYARRMLYKHIDQLFNFIGSPLEISVQKSSLTILKLIYNHAYKLSRSNNHCEPEHNFRASKDSSSLSTFADHESKSEGEICSVIIDKIKASHFWSPKALSTFVEIEEGEGNANRSSPEPACETGDFSFPGEHDCDEKGVDLIMSDEQQVQITKELFENNDMGQLKCMTTSRCKVQIKVEGQRRAIFKEASVDWNTSSIATKMDDGNSYWPLFPLGQYQWRCKMKGTEEVLLRFSEWDDQKPVDIVVRFASTDLRGDVKDFITTLLDNSYQIRQHTTGLFRADEREREEDEEHSIMSDDRFDSARCDTSDVLLIGGFGAEVSEVAAKSERDHDDDDQDGVLGRDVVHNADVSMDDIEVVYGAKEDEGNSMGATEVKESGIQGTNRDDTGVGISPKTEGRHIGSDQYDNDSVDKVEVEKRIEDEGRMYDEDYQGENDEYSSYSSGVNTEDPGTYVNQVNGSDGKVTDDDSVGEYLPDEEDEVTVQHMSEKSMKKRSDMGANDPNVKYDQSGKQYKEVPSTPCRNKGHKSDLVNIGNGGEVDVFTTSDGSGSDMDIDASTQDGHCATADEEVDADNADSYTDSSSDDTDEEADDDRRDPDYCDPADSNDRMETTDAEQIPAQPREEEHEHDTSPRGASQNARAGNESSETTSDAFAEQKLMQYSAVRNQLGQGLANATEWLREDWKKTEKAFEDKGNEIRKRRDDAISSCEKKWADKMDKVAHEMSERVCKHYDERINRAKALQKRLATLKKKVDAIPKKLDAIHAEVSKQLDVARIACEREGISSAERLNEIMKQGMAEVNKYVGRQRKLTAQLKQVDQWSDSDVESDSE